MAQFVHIYLSFTPQKNKMKFRILYYLFELTGYEFCNFITFLFCYGIVKKFSDILVVKHACWFSSLIGSDLHHQPRWLCYPVTEYCCAVQSGSLHTSLINIQIHTSVCILQASCVWPLISTVTSSCFIVLHTGNQQLTVHCTALKLVCVSLSMLMSLYSLTAFVCVFN